MCNRAVEHGVATFLELSFAVHWQVVRITAPTKLLTTAMMVDLLKRSTTVC